VGIATLLARAKKRRPEELTDADLADAANYIETMFVKPPLTSLLSMALPNSGFTQPAFDVGKKQEYARIVSGSLGAAFHQSNEQCVFTGEPALSIPLSFKETLPPGRAYRQHIPLLTGEGVINFFPDGDAGLPVSGIALLALQILPLGCAKCGIGLLAAHSDNPQMTLALTRRFYDTNTRALSQALAAGESKLPSAHRSPKTLLVETLIEADNDRLDLQEGSLAGTSLTAYNFSNSGQGADLVIYSLPMEMLDFLRVAQTQTYREAWNQLVHRSWQIAKAKRGDAEAGTAEFVPRHNYLYEDLFGLDNPQSWGRFVRTYFLRIPRLTRAEDDPRRTYSFRDELQLVSWPLIELFLRKVTHMDAERIAQIRMLGDKLAIYVEKDGKDRFFNAFFRVKRADDLRLLLLQANLRAIKSGGDSLYDMDTYIGIFQESDDVMRPDWRLARDLVLMRMIDQLKDKWGQQLREAVTEADLQINADIVNS
jgi:CRISPR-associated protein Cst1